MTFGPLFELDAIDVIGDPICTDVETWIDNVHHQKKKQNLFPNHDNDDSIQNIALKNFNS